MLKCRGCNAESVTPLVDFGSQPIVHHLGKKPPADAKTYPFDLGACQSCGLVAVLRPIAPEILYENYFTISSWKAQPHMPRLIEVIEGLSCCDENSKILDIGCNDGGFIQVLQSRGFRNVSGIEPSNDAYAICEKEKLDVVHKFFTKKVAGELYGEKKFDVITTRQVLEHIVALEDFLGGIHLILKDDGLLAIEIPNGSLNLDYLDYGLWEEHVNYFTLETLRRIMNVHGFTIIHHEVTLFSGCCLTIFCQKKEPSAHTPEKAGAQELAHTARFGTECESFKASLREFLQAAPQPVYIYGCGARSSNFVNFLGVADLIAGYIDDQAEKQNMYVPGSLKKITAWDEKAHRKATILLGVNTENERKVIAKRNLDEKQVFSITPPSKYLPPFWKKMI